MRQGFVETQLGALAIKRLFRCKRACLPAYLSSTISPGATRRRKNTNTATPNNVGIMSNAENISSPLSPFS